MRQRYALGIEYDGSAFYGFQIQVNCDTVQGALEKALSRFTNEIVRVVAAGRTDTGVHARGQVVHFETQAKRSVKDFCFGTNYWVHAAIRILWAKPVSNEFHARKSAIAREYEYIIYNHALRPALFRKQVTWHNSLLEVEKMQEAANSWLGEQDFSAFRAASCQSHSAVRRMAKIKVIRKGDFVVVNFKCNAFLHHMIRNMLGVLLPIGDGRAPVSWARKVLDGKNRACAGVTSTPNGLYLQAIQYPSFLEIPSSCVNSNQLSFVI